MDVTASNNALYTQLDTERFFNCVRPYYKPYRVGKEVYRGANAGDFAGINVIDMLLGLCSAFCIVITNDFDGSSLQPNVCSI